MLSPKSLLLTFVGLGGLTQRLEDGFNISFQYNPLLLQCIWSTFQVVYAFETEVVCFTLVNVYVDLVVFTRIAGTSYTGSGRYRC